MPYEFNKTARKAFLTFLATGIAGVIGYLSSLTSAEQSVYFVILLPLLRVVEDYLRHRNDEDTLAPQPATPTP